MSWISREVRERSQARWWITDGISSTGSSTRRWPIWRRKRALRQKPVAGGHNWLRERRKQPRPSKRLSHPPARPLKSRSRGCARSPNTQSGSASWEERRRPTSRGQSPKPKRLRLFTFPEEWTKPGGVDSEARESGTECSLPLSASPTARSKITCRDHTLSLSHRQCGESVTKRIRAGVTL